MNLLNIFSQASRLLPIFKTSQNELTTRIDLLTRNNASLMFFVLDINSPACSELRNNHVNKLGNRKMLPIIVFYNKLYEFLSRKCKLRNINQFFSKLIDDAKKVFSLKQNQEFLYSKDPKVVPNYV